MLIWGDEGPGLGLVSDSIRARKAVETTQENLILRKVILKGQSDQKK
jgi:hypothetical protein